MASNITKLQQWQERIARFHKSGSSLTQFCKEEQVSPESYYYWRERIRFIGPAVTKTQPAGASSPSSSSPSSSIQFSIQVDKLKIDCQASSLDAIPVLLNWAQQCNANAFQSVLVRG